MNLYRKVETKKEMTMKRMMALLTAVAISAVSSATPTISNVKVTPISPLGLAIDYNVSGAKANYSLQVSATVGNETYVAKTLVGGTNCENGSRRVYWNMAKDGITQDATDAEVSLRYVDAPYCVIDLLNGAEAGSYLVAYTNVPSSEVFNTTEYKTTKLVLKRVDAGSFKMQGSLAVTLTKPFYMGLFEVTQKQWMLVTGTNKNWNANYGKGETLPAYYVSYNDIRGSSDGAMWPVTNAVDLSSFLGKLRTRTGLLFDLPTEAQWEYTCRAGTTTTYNYGDVANGDYMWSYDLNSDGKSHEVGTKLPNDWGFYDMHGNVWEWCLDRCSYSVLPSSGTDPKGPSSGSARVFRGGAFDRDSGSCTSSSRGYFGTSGAFDDRGLRLSIPLP